jgi:hypothetical protein
MSNGIIGRATASVICSTIGKRCPIFHLDKCGDIPNLIIRRRKDLVRHGVRECGQQDDQEALDCLTRRLPAFSRKESIRPEVPDLNGLKMNLEYPPDLK